MKNSYNTTFAMARRRSFSLNPGNDAPTSYRLCRADNEMSAAGSIPASFEISILIALFSRTSASACHVSSRQPARRQRPRCFSARTRTSSACATSTWSATRGSASASGCARAFSSASAAGDPYYCGGADGSWPSATASSSASAWTWSETASAISIPSSSGSRTASWTWIPICNIACRRRRSSVTADGSCASCRRADGRCSCSCRGSESARTRTSSPARSTCAWTATGCGSRSDSWRPSSCHGCS